MKSLGPAEFVLVAQSTAIESLGSGKYINMRGRLAGTIVEGGQTCPLVTPLHYSTDTWYYLEGRKLHYSTLQSRLAHILPRGPPHYTSLQALAYYYVV